MRLHIWAFAALAGVGALAGSARAQADPKEVVATVNGRAITMGEIKAAMKAGGIPDGPPGPEMTRTVHDMACRLIDGVLWEEYLKKNGPRISKSEVEKRFAELEKTVKEHGHTMAFYYAETGQTEDQVRAGIASVLQWDAIVRKKISDADVKQFYEKNRDLFDGLQVSARHIVMRVPPGATPPQKQEIRNSLLSVRAHIIAGEFDFAEAAKRFSQDPTFEKGGDLGKIPRQYPLPESFLRAAFAQPVNTIGGVVESEVGMHLILVTAREYATGHAPEFEQVKDQVRAVCADEFRQSVMEQLRSAAKVKFN